MEREGMVMVSPKKEVAVAVRMEYDKSSDDVFIVFRIVDEQFKQKVRDDWKDDIEVRLINTTLVVEEE
jgi:hypothetical protein